MSSPPQDFIAEMKGTGKSCKDVFRLVSVSLPQASSFDCLINPPKLDLLLFFDHAPALLLLTSRVEIGISLKNTLLYLAISAKWCSQRNASFRALSGL